MNAPALPKKRVLFVDDEVPILRGLENLLYRDRARWDMVFAVGAERALETMRAKPFDVVVTDMRMPGMDGAALLDVVRREFPSTVRIVLSGHAEREAILRALPLMHQYLRKPCEPGALRAAILRSLDPGRQPSRDVRALVGQIDKLPTPKAVYFDLQRLTRDPASNLEDMARCVEGDPAVAAKLLQLANSAAFGAARPASTIGDAISYLGTELLGHLVMMSSLFAYPPQPGDVTMLLERLYARSIRAATLVRGFLADRAAAELGFAAALLHDVAEGVLAAGLRETYLPLRAAAHATHEPLVLAERRELGACHAELGGFLLGVWGLPAPLVDLVRFHHSPRDADPALRPVMAALHVADALCSEHDSDGAIDHEFLAEAGVAELLPTWRSIAETR